MIMQEVAANQNWNPGLPTAHLPFCEAAYTKAAGGPVPPSLSCFLLLFTDSTRNCHCKSTFFRRTSFHRKSYHRSMQESHLAKGIFSGSFNSSMWSASFALSVQQEQNQLSLDGLLALSKARAKIRNSVSPLERLCDLFPVNNNVCVQFCDSIGIKDKMEKSDRWFIIQHPHEKSLCISYKCLTS